MICIKKDYSHTADTYFPFESFSGFNFFKITCKVLLSYYFLPNIVALPFNFTNTVPLKGSRA